MKKISLILAVVACLFVGCKQQNNSTSNKVQMKIASFNLRFDETMHKKFDDPKKADHWNARRAVIVPMMRYHGVDIFISQELFAHQIKQLEAELRKADKEIIALHEAKEKLIADNARSETLLLLADKEHEQLEQTRQELSDHKADLKITKDTLTQTKQELDTKTAELGKFHKSILGFYRKDT